MLTSAGRRVFEYAEKLLALAAEMEAAIKRKRTFAFRVSALRSAEPRWTSLARAACAPPFLALRCLTHVIQTTQLKLTAPFDP